MRTTLDLPAELLRNAQLTLGTTTKTATITAALKEVLRHRDLQKIIGHRGAVKIDPAILKQRYAR